jgi:hypothetical protein
MTLRDDTANYEKASPLLLSKQAAQAIKPKGVIDNHDWQALKGHLEGRLVSLRQWRTSWWTQNWSNLAEFILPRRSIWLTQSAGGLPTPNNMNRGREINQSIVDPTGTFAARICSGGLMSGLASPSRPWFKVIVKGLQELDEDARLWLDETESRIYTVLAGSNFYNSFAQECEDLVVFGTSPVIMYEDEIDIIRFYNPAVGEYYLASSSTNRVDGLYRAFVMTIAQIVDFFGLDNCSQEIQQLWQAKGASLQMERIVAHSIEPNFGIHGSGSTVGKIPGNFTWRETYWLWGAFSCARWATQSNDAYGRSPGMDVLPDIMQLQSETRRKAEGIEKQVRPPLIADMKMKNQPASVLPGHITYVDGLTTGSGMRSIYEVNPDLNAMMLDLKEIQQRIKVGLFNDLFLMLEQNNGRMTAYEVAQKQQEKLTVLGPVIEGMLAESLKPKLKRVYSIMKKRGLISEPPDSLKGQPLDIEFVSIMAMAQKAAATGGMERIAALVGNLSAVYPEVRDNLDPDIFVKEMNSLLGNPEKIMRGPEIVAQMREQQAQAANQQKNMEMAHGMAQTAAVGADAANVLSNTQVGASNSALSAILGTGNR